MALCWPGHGGPAGVFTSHNDTPAAGDWRGIYFGDKAGNSILNYWKYRMPARTTSPTRIASIKWPRSTWMAAARALIT